MIAAALRTPVGRRDGDLSGVHAVDLSALTLQGLVDRTGIDPTVVDDVLWGCVIQAGEQSGNVGRYAVLAAGWPEEVPGTTIDRQCGSSQQALHFAAAGVASGQYDLVVAGGVEAMSRVPLGSNRVHGPGEPYGPMALARYGGGPFNQGVGAELVAERWKLSREELDAIALESHARAARAIDDGLFAAEILPVAVPDGNGGRRTVDTDGGVRRGGTLEGLGKLRTVFKEDGVVTAGNASQISDGAAAMIVTTPERAAELGLRPLVRLHSFALAGVDPISMLTGPIPATRKVLDRAGLTIDQIDTFEVNEAFASIVGAWLAETGVDPRKLNPTGGAIALGHPLGCSGARLMTTMVHRMQRDGLRYGLQAICEGGGTANATIVENLQVG